MAERVSALAALPLDLPAAAGVTLADVRVGSIVQLAAWPGTLDRVEQAMTDLVASIAPRLGMAGIRHDLTVAALAPGRFLLLAEAEGLAARFEAALPSEDGAVTDLSHGRTVMRLSGPYAASVLAQGAAVDLDLAQFPESRAAQTVIHHIDVTIIRREPEVFDLVVLRGFGHAFAEWLLDAAKATPS